MGDFSQGLQGAAGGAMAGSFAGPAGALVGGGLGLLGGLFGDSGASQYQDMLKQLAGGYANRQAPQAGAANTTNYSGYRGNQQGLVAQLEAMARGEGPSPAALQMREAMDRAAGAQASAAAGAGGRGVNAGAALRQASNNTAAIQSQGARDTATMRAQEQVNAIGQLGQTLAQGRAADENVNMFNAGQQNDMMRANLQAKLQTMGLNDESQLKALMMALGSAGPGMGASILAGGASALPSILQYNQQKNLLSQLAGQGSGGTSGGGMFGGYQRNGDGSTDPVTSPSQV